MANDKLLRKRMKESLLCRHKVYAGKLPDALHSDTFLLQTSSKLIFSVFQLVIGELVCLHKHYNILTSWHNFAPKNERFLINKRASDHSSFNREKTHDHLSNYNIYNIYTSQMVNQSSNK